MLRWQDGPIDPRLERATAATAGLRERLRAHPIYASVHDLAAARTFMEAHVFAVWDFMALLKRLQRDLTSTASPWRPVGDATVRRFVNELVLGEESDEHPAGGFTSHFELYLEAMSEAGCDTRAIRAVVEARDPLAAMRAHGVPAFVVDFVAYDLELAQTGATHEVAAAFTFGREELIPAMFRQLTRAAAGEPRLHLFTAYLERHVVLDGDVHAPMAASLLALQCGDDAAKWADVERVAARALTQRLALWDGLRASLGG